MLEYEDSDILPLDPSPLVLVVEDELTPRSIVIRMVRSLGFQARGYHSGDAALGFLHEHPGAARLVLADLGNATDGWRGAGRACAGSGAALARGVDGRSRRPPRGGSPGGLFRPAVPREAGRVRRARGAARRARRRSGLDACRGSVERQSPDIRPPSYFMRPPPARITWRARGSPDATQPRNPHSATLSGVGQSRSAFGRSASSAAAPTRRRMLPRTSSVPGSQCRSTCHFQQAIDATPAMRPRSRLA